MVEATRIDHRGRCACGASTVTLRGMIAAMTECWCADCQKETGGSCTHTVIVDEDGIELAGPEPGRFERQSDRAAKVTRLFCQSCGTTLTSFTESMAFRGVRAGILDDHGFFRPQVVLFSRSAPSWAKFPDGANIFDTQPEQPARLPD